MGFYHWHEQAARVLLPLLRVSHLSLLCRGGGHTASGFPPSRPLFPIADRHVDLSSILGRPPLTVSPLLPLAAALCPVPLFIKSL